MAKDRPPSTNLKAVIPGGNTVGMVARLGILEANMLAPAYTIKYPGGDLAQYVDLAVRHI